MAYHDPYKCCDYLWQKTLYQIAIGVFDTQVTQLIQRFYPDSVHTTLTMIVN